MTNPGGSGNQKKSGSDWRHDACAVVPKVHSITATAVIRDALIFVSRSYLADDRHIIRDAKRPSNTQGKSC